MLELSGSPGVFKDFFKHRGTTDLGKASIQSISTYLGQEFNLRDPSDGLNPIAARYGTVTGASGIWSVPDPAPNPLKPLWDEIVESFDNFCRDVAIGGGFNAVTGRDAIRDFVHENNNVFVGLWRTFFWYSFVKRSGGAVTPAIPRRLAGRVLPWLNKQRNAKRLSGSRNAYRSGSGAARISDKIIELLGGP